MTVMQCDIPIIRHTTTFHAGLTVLLLQFRPVSPFLEFFGCGLPDDAARLDKIFSELFFRCSVAL